MPKKKITSGTKAPKSGQYMEFGPRGGKKKEVTVVKGEPLPLSTKGGYFELVDKTKNKRNK